MARYTELRLTPATGTTLNAKVLNLKAQLVVDPGLTPRFPDTLNFTVVRKGGGASGSLSAVFRANGVYTTQWTPPGDGEFLVTAAYPEAGGPSTSVTLTVDKTPPQLVVQVPPATPGVATDGFIYADPLAATAWHRDQSVTVRVESDSADLDPSSLRGRVSGVGSTVILESLAVTPTTPCVGRAFCGTMDVPLWKPSMSAFRGDFTVSVTAKDRIGNEGSSSATFPVTRWKWSFDGGGGAIRSSPAIGELGTIYFGTTDANGKVFALAPQGQKTWEAQLGAVQGSPAVGAYIAGSERVYVAVNKDGAGTLYGLGPRGTADATEQCPLGVSAAAVAVSSTRLSGETSALETAVTVGNEHSLVALRIGAAASDRCVRSIEPNTNVLPGASVVVRGGDFYFGNSDNKVLGYTLGEKGWGAKTGFFAPSVDAGVTGLAFSGGIHLIGAAGSSGTPMSGGVFSFVALDGSNPWQSPDPFRGEPVRNMSVGANNVVIYGRDVAAGPLTAVNLLSTPVRSAVNAGSLVGSPVLGASNVLYTAAASGPSPSVGDVTAWEGLNFIQLWKLSDSVGRAEATPALDCARNPDGTGRSDQHGVLYVPSIDGRLYAFVVDSPGLNRSVPWPRYQHDARNTGNPATPITSCPPPAP